jgi:shikimate 5-dehydrogenase
MLGQTLWHSLSPADHNRALRQIGIDAVYLPFETDHP